MFNLLSPAKYVRRFTRIKARSQLSSQAGAIARWDNEGGAPSASDRRNIPQDEQHRRRAPIADGELGISLMREVSPISDSRELRALDDLYHQSFWRVQN